jgi:hypothetical protein
MARLKARGMHGILAGLIAAAVLTGCNKNPDQTDAKPFQPPTATEVFNLRSQCAEFAMKWRSAGYPFRTTSWVSHYAPRSNRCYIKTESSSVNPTNNRPKTLTSLYDGQTEELLAWTSQEGESLSASLTGWVGVDDWRGFAAGLGITSNEIPESRPSTERVDWRFAGEVIDKAMEDDRRQ